MMELVNLPVDDKLVNEANLDIVGDVVNPSTFDFQELLTREGRGDAHVDSGGLTKYGITTAWGLSEDEIRNLTEGDALKIYGDKYNHWASSWQGDGGSQAIGDKMFDVSVNMGRSGGNKVMQNVLNTMGYPTSIDGGWTESGETDKNYKKAIAEHGEPAVLNSIIQEQKRHYSDIVASDPKKYGAYARGWQGRADFMGPRKPQYNQSSTGPSY